MPRGDSNGSSGDTRRGGPHRERILAAARKRVEEDGLGRVTVAAVAAEVGLSQPTVYRYFRGRDELFSAAIGKPVSLRGRKGESRRQKILDAALSLFSERGFRETTMAAVAEVVGLSEAALYRYFESKDALFTELVRERMTSFSLMSGWDGLAQAERALADPRSSFEADDLEATLLAVASSVMDAFVQHPEAMRLIFTEGLKFEGTAAAAYEALFAPTAETLEAILAQADRSGTARIPEPGIAARGFLGMFAFFMIVAQLFLPQAGGRSRYERERIATTLVGMFLDGVRRLPCG